MDAQKKPAAPRLGGGGLVMGSGDDRLSRHWHYHGPGGLNGRVRDGNGWGPAGIVAGNRPGGGQAPSTVGGSGWSVTRATGKFAGGSVFIRSGTPDGSGSSSDGSSG